MSDRLGDESLAPELFAQLQDAFGTKQGRVATTRWFQYVQRLKEFLPKWHSRLAVYIYLVASMGIEVGLRETGFLRQRLVAGDEAADQNSGPTRIDKDEVRAAKKTCANGLHFCVLVLMDRELWHLQNGILCIMDIVSTTFSEHSHRLRSFSDAQVWYMEQACGGSFSMLGAVLRRTFENSTAEAAGLWVSGALPAGMEWGGFDGEHPLVVSQNFVARHLCSLAVMLLKHFARASMWHCVCWPGSFAALLDPARRQETLDLMRVD